MNLTRLFALAGTLSACSSEVVPLTTTDSIATSDIALAADVQGNGEAVAMTVAISAVDGSRLALGTGDQLLAAAEGAASRPLVMLEPGSYGGLVSTTAQQVVLTLARPNESVTAALDLPAPFTLTVPATPVTRLDSIALSWNAGTAGDVMLVDVWGPCTPGVHDEVSPDHGSYDIAPSELAYTGACTLTVAVTRVETGAFPGMAPLSGAYDSEQVRTATVEVAP
jgi:hypothetical protein